GIRDRNVTGVQTCALPIWTVTINWSIVEIWSELIPSVLGSFSHKCLTAQCDIRLMGFAVTIVLVPPAIELNHLNDVLLVPTYIVMEKAIAIIGGLFGNFW